MTHTDCGKNVKFLHLAKREEIDILLILPFDKDINTREQRLVEL